jgi:WD40 repeat protein
MIEMLNISNILALVGGCDYPKFSPNKITIWDDHQGKIVSQIRFNSDVIKVKIRKDSIIGVLFDKIYILNISTLETIDILETYPNLNGIFSISNMENELLVAYPSPQMKGRVQIENYSFSIHGTKKLESKTINAHESQIAYISINNQGTVLATASDKGTLIRIFLLNKTEQPIASLRRGKKNAKINWLVFSLDNEIIGCTSDSGTAHLFNISELNKLIVDKKSEEEKKEKNNKKEKNIKINIKEKSFGQFKIQESQSIIGFYQAQRIILITESGKYYKILYDTKEGCEKKEEGTLEIENANI